MTSERPPAVSPSIAADTPASLATRAPELLDRLLTAVSHDLRTPLLSVSLGLELLEGEGLALDEEQRATARESVDAGLRDLERLLDAVSAVSRARRRPLDGAPLALGEVLAGHVLLTQEPEARSLHPAVDPLLPRELCALLGGARPAEVYVERADGLVRLSIQLPRDAGVEVEGCPLTALLGSLETHAGTLIERLAALQVLALRQGATLALERSAAVLEAPLTQDR